MEEELPTARTLERHCSCPPQLRVLYRTVPFVHPDAVALDAVAGLLNGPSGRLYRSLVQEHGLASKAWAEHKALREAGKLTFAATALDRMALEELEQAWDQEVKRLHTQEVPARELLKVKNQLIADGYRRLEAPSSLMIRLLIYDSLGDWRYLTHWARKVEALTAADIQNGVSTYLVPQRSVTSRFLRELPIRGRK
jgi:predicted Zn-dependent peptidase